ncbi:hypothetical protein Patl1_26579 [Pistacia atlantica]|uniref:Uncharacterized protein n=1 Tax=Pistacia atlantica TaxID=434234 RepID=A0ACC1B4Q9_9ROSI|nr:hypothetical protein Patl1_26579 [Pistacia atlantica]
MMALKNYAELPSYILTSSKSSKLRNNNHSAAIIFSFVASITGLLIASKKRPEILRNLYFIISLFSIVSAISILAFVLFVESYKLFSTGCKFMM